MEIIHDGQTIPYLEPKSPNSQLKYRFRVDGLAVGEIITAYGFLVNGQAFTSGTVDGLQFVGVDSDGNDEVSLELNAGTLNATYLITFWYSTSVVARHEQSVKLPVRKV